MITPGRTWSWSGLGGDLTVGQLLRYTDSKYSHYDNCSAYGLRDAEGNEFWWALHDDEPLNTWREVFAVVGSAE